jgi:DNA-binding MarR family transcriptional regulator
MTGKTLVEKDVSRGRVPPGRRIAAALARRFVLISTCRLAELVSQHDLVPLEYVVLAYLSDEPDIDQTGLAARLGVDRSNAGLLVDRLEVKGLVQRRVNGDDRRAKILRLTSRGARLFERICPIARATQDRVLSTLTKAEREQLIELLARVVEANEAYIRPGAGRRKPRIRRPDSAQT